MERVLARLTRLLPQCGMQKLFLFAVYAGKGEAPATTRLFTADELADEIEPRMRTLILRPLRSVKA